MNWFGLLGLDAVAVRWRAALIEGVIAVEDRMDLARLEWLDQKKRLQSLLILIILVGGLTVIALTLLSFAFLVQFWDTSYRITVAWLVAGTWVAAWVGALVTLITVIQRTANGFALTRQELAQDWCDLKERL